MTLAQRLPGLPLVLGGPIVRRVDDRSVTVWIALKSGADPVTLRVFDPSGQEMMRGARPTIAVGANFHVVAVTATGQAGTLRPGIKYRYDMGVAASHPSLRTAGSVEPASVANPVASITYPGEDYPSFALPPTLDSLRLVHASCRKPHGEGPDALPAVGLMIAGAINQPLQRPHQLFLTGDQIYADDVADQLLADLIEAGSALLGYAEQVYVPGAAARAAPPPPGRRAATMRRAGFSGMADNKPHLAKSHLITLGEFLAMYLFAWSEVPWGPPWFADPGDPERSRVTAFRATVGAVRRVLANVPTYMIFDDHEVSDDWFINRAWCENVLNARLGRRVLTNGLLSYALCQAWGNTPDRFVPGQAGATVLDATVRLSQASRGTSIGASSAVDWAAIDGAYADLEAVLGVPTRAAFDAAHSIPHPATAMTWHYTVRGPQHEVIVLDTRTWRRYPGPIDFALLLSNAGLDAQIALLDQPGPPVTCVVAAAPVIGVPFLEDKQREASTLDGRYSKDAEAWGLNAEGMQRLLGRLASRFPLTAVGGGQRRRGRVVILSGDVHYSMTARVQYWAPRPYGARAGDSELVAAQITSSSARNQTSNLVGTLTLHSAGYSPISGLSGEHRVPGPALVYAWASGLSALSPERPTVYNADPLLRGMVWRLDEERLINGQATGFPEPDWRYRVDWLISEDRVRAPARTPPRAVTTPPRGERTEALRQYMALSRNHADYAREWGAGRELVGVNNVGEVSFEGDPAADTLRVVHEVWWHLESADRTRGLPPFPLTRTAVSLRFDDPAYPRPQFTS